MSTDDSTSNTNQPNDGGPPSNLSSIDALTSNMNQLKDNGPADLKLSTDTRDKYLTLIGAYRTALEAERKRMNGLETLGNVGTLGSAAQTKTNLQLDVTDLTGIQQTVDKYLKYLDAFEDTVKKACDRLIQSG